MLDGAAPSVNRRVERPPLRPSEPCRCQDHGLHRPELEACRSYRLTMLAFP